MTNAAAEVSNNKSSTSELTSVAQRLVSIDAYRGCVMFLMLAEMLHLDKGTNVFPESSFWKWIQFHTTHVAWTGCSLHDLIQPSFSFLVGVALPFSLAKRMQQQQTVWSMYGHALLRAMLLIGLGIFLRSLGKPQTNFTFEDTLTQIGLGYFPLFLLGLQKPIVRWATLAVILVGYWALFALYPLPAPDFDLASVGVKPDWAHQFQGFAAHWNLNTNPAAAFDRWFLNLFPREKAFEYNRGGYSTLSFIPTLGTMMLGLFAGEWLKSDQSKTKKLTLLGVAAIVCLAFGWGLELAGICPIVKKIWTPSWTLWSGGCCFVFLAIFYALVDVIGWKRWTFPLVVIGANSIAIYVMSWTVEGWVGEALKRHFGEGTFALLGEQLQPMLLGAATLATLWLVLLWLYRQRIFIRL